MSPSSLPRATWERFFAASGRFGTLLGLLLDALLGRLGPLLGRSEEALGNSLGAFGEHLEPPEASRPLPGPIWEGFWVDLGVNLGRFGDRFR